MKSTTKSIAKILTAAMLVVLMIVSALPMVSAAPASTTLLDTTKKVSFTATCATPGYTFKLYKVASLDVKTDDPYETKYTSLIPTVTNAEVKNAIDSGDPVDLLAELDTIAVGNLPTAIDTFGPTSATVTSKTFTNLAQGVYYVKAVNYPAGVTEVRNSVFALPYFPDNTTGWKYTIDDIPLATKVKDQDITTEKTITNSTKGNVNFTDVGIGDTVNFEIRSTVTGEKAHDITTPDGDTYHVEDFKLNSYYVVDDMSKGLKLNKNSFKVSLLKEDGTLIKELTATGTSPDYTVTYSAGFDGTDVTKNTKFTVALTPTYLQKDDFYEADVYYTSITYSAVLNEEAVVGRAGNPNDEVEIVYSNKNDVVKKHDGNTVWVYTYGVTNTKTDTKDVPLAGATFELYKTLNDATNKTNPIARGTSDANGKVVYNTIGGAYAGQEITLTEGTYYAVETIAPTGYNLYGKVITIDATATYYDVFTNGSYVKTEPTNGTATFTVKDSMLIVPKTGGYGDFVLYGIGGVVGIVGISALAIAVIKLRKKEATK